MASSNLDEAAFGAAAYLRDRGCCVRMSKRTIITLSWIPSRPGLVSVAGIKTSSQKATCEKGGLFKLTLPRCRPPLWGSEDGRNSKEAEHSECMHA